MINFLGKKFNRKIFATILLIVLVLCGSLTTGNNVFASEESYSWIGKVASNIFMQYGEDLSDNATGPYSLIEMGASDNDDAADEAVGPSVWLVNLSAKFLTWTVSTELYDEVFFSKAAKQGITQAWEAVRGFVNMFYLLILVFLAITTILRINNFSDKKLFFNVIVSAVLVNFSLPITLVVIDFSNLVMTYFASAIQGVGTVSVLLDQMGMAKLETDPSWMLGPGVEIAGFIINIVTAVMIFFVGISLLIRLVAYWVLIILSPLAFFSIAIPGNNGFNEWRDKLVHYSFYGPIMLFFIWLALALSAYLKRAFIEYPGGSGLDEFVKFFTSYVTVLYILYYGHEKSTEMAKKAGDFAGKIMEKGGQYAVKAGKNVGTLGMAPLAESYGKAAYTGGKTLLKRNKFTKGWTEDGAKEIQEDRNRKAEYYASSKGKKESMDMQDAEKTIGRWKESGTDIENEDVLADKLRSGSKKEQQAAALQLAKLGKLGIDSTGNRYTDAKKVVAENKFLNKAIERGAGGKNKTAVYKHHLANSRSASPNAESVEFVNKKIDTAMEEANQNGGTYTIGNAASRAVFVNERRLDYESNVGRTATMDEGQEQAVLAGIFSEATSNVDLAKMANEQRGAEGRNVTEHMATYLKSASLGASRYRTPRSKEMIADNLRGDLRGVLNHRGVV